MELENDKRELTTAALIVALAAVLISAISLYFIVSVSVRLDRLTTEAEKLNSAVSELAAGEETGEQVFVLHEYEGVIGVFDSSGVLVDIINVKVMSLPEADRKMLESGIYAFSRGELLSLIEDYTE
ncbi:MAG: hypothetical protein GX057_04315 [Clostridiales bacterium]|jgi:hypothetical protein|nr:hypothetical protein [Clostridiales bacterium]HOA84781.1 hypothetical protein [Bacillota bacterium]